MGNNYRKYKTDKSQRYLINYDVFFKPLVNKRICLLELGVDKGGSLLLWRDYFRKATIVGLDINAVSIKDASGRIHIYQGRQEDTELLDIISRETAPNGFDVIIDDCSHIGELTRMSFWHLFNNHLKSGGLYVIEDWGTGYWNRWLDGNRYKSRDRSIFYRIFSFFIFYIKHVLKGRNKQWFFRLNKLIHYKERFQSHDYGMVGFIKELVDECGMGDISHPKWGISPARSSRFHKMQISPGQVIIIKSH